MYNELSNKLNNQKAGELSSYLLEKYNIDYAENNNYGTTIQGYCFPTDTYMQEPRRFSVYINDEHSMIVERHANNLYDFNFEAFYDKDMQFGAARIRHCNEQDGHIKFITINKDGKLTHSTQQKIVNAEGRTEYPFITDYEIEGVFLSTEQIRDLMQNGTKSETFNNVIEENHTNSMSR